jgi:hypothetical protein
MLATAAAGLAADPGLMGGDLGGGRAMPGADRGADPSGFGAATFTSLSVGRRAAGLASARAGVGERASRVAGDGGVRAGVSFTTGGGGALGTSGSATGPTPGTSEGGAGGTSLIGMMKPHFLHFIRTDRPDTFSSAIWYFALQLGQRNFMRWLGRVSSGRAPQRSRSRCSLMDSRVASSGASARARCHVSTALFRNPDF